jgi:hypothetical protein
VLAIEANISHILGKCCTTELHPSPDSVFLTICLVGAICFRVNLVKIYFCVIKPGGRIARC